MATKVFITIEQGAVLNKIVHRVRTTMGVPVNMSTYTGLCTLKKNYSASVGYSLGVTFSANGEVILTDTAEATGSIPEGRYVYDVIGQSNTAAPIERIIEGYMSVTPQVSSLT